MIATSAHELTVAAPRYSRADIAQGVTAEDISLVVLCGGRGQRMGGADKGLLSYRGLSLIEHQLQTFADQGFELLISANRNLAQYRRYGLPAINDRTPDYPGPLAGMQSAMQLSSRPWLVCVPCDLIGLPQDSALQLVASACRANVPAAYAVDARREHYAFCALHRSLAESLQQALTQKQRAVHRFLSAHRAVGVDFRPHLFANLNDPESWSWAAP